MNRLARMMALTLALLCLFTIAAGAAVARLLPARLAWLEMPQVSARAPARPGASLAASQPALSGHALSAAAVTTRLSGLIGSGNLGANAGAMVTNLSTGKVLYQLKQATGFAPASTTKIATAIAALNTLGPQARFTTKVTLPAGHPSTSAGSPVRIVLVGGGDPTLAAGRYPASDYPQPATLSALAAATAKALRGRHVTDVRLSFDATLFGGPLVAKGWPSPGAADNYVSSGNFTPITGLEVDQGRLTASGAPEDADDPANYRPRSTAPSVDAAHAFARFLDKDGITVHGGPRAVRGAAQARTAGHGTELAAVQSPPLAAIVQQMLTESNNVIAETLARHVAVATGRPGTFAGAAAAVMAVVARLHVAGLHLYDGSGLSPMDRISPRALVALITLAAKTGRLRSVITGLPVAGFSGTLGPGSFFGPFGRAALGAVRAKTGNLTHVATMAGLAYTSSGQILAFAFMGNDIASKLGTQPELTLAELATALAGCGCR